MCGQDRVARHPATWAAMIEMAITGAAGTPAPWTAFKDEVTAALVPAGEPPIILLDHTGAPRTSGDVRLVAGADTLTLGLTGADAGDLQRTVERLHAANAAAVPRTHVFDGAATVTVGMLPAGDHQLTRIEDGTTAANEITVPAAGGHIMSTDLPSWFAPQFATPLGGAPAPARYTRGNLIQPFVNGPEFFDDLFRVLHAARNANGGFHLTGWVMFPDQDFTTTRAGDPADLARTLHEAAERIATAGGASRFLPAQFYNLQPADSVSGPEIFAFSVLMIGLLAARDVDFVHTDAAGVVVLLALMIANLILISVMLETGGRPLEPNNDAVNVLDPLDRTFARLAPFPAEVADNPVAPPTSEFPFSTVFTVDRHFGVYHQKLAVVKRGTDDFVGYCGGVDLNPDRLDDVRHLIKLPFHDVHARFEGPAVRDLALSFEQRWTRDGGGEAPAFTTPTAASLGTPGRTVVQIARTYFKAAATARRLDFAPLGDRTIHDTLLQAIAAAHEFIYIEDQYFTPPAAYRAALTAKVASGDIKRLVVTLPGITDQPFGELVRSGLINDLLVADAGRGIVRIGYPRRHYTLPDNDLRASSGRCVLTEDLAAGGGTTSTVCLGPAARLPSPPFWLAIDGELMYVNDEAIAAASSPAPAGSTRFAVVRGDSTRLIKGGASPRGARPRAHSAGAAATVIDLANIYVHAKMMIVDDVFLSVGSANLNRRGLFHDGEINAFAVPERLKGDTANPVRDLRLRLWAEMLDLPEDLAAPLLADPVAATALFDRSPLLGNRYTDILAYPEHVMFGVSGGDGIVSTVLQIAVGVPLLAVDHVKLFDGAVDPTSALETP
jgi:phosphatidylserine/phosphatidylglycerophosphate/cardiolipin synthase-like enzyme